MIKIGKKQEKSDNSKLGPNHRLASDRKAIILKNTKFLVAFWSYI